MKKLIVFILFFTAVNLVSYGQCSSVTVQITSSDTTYVQLYQAGFFLIPSGFDNICEWNVTSFTGQTIHQDTTSGEFNDQSTTIFNHSIPITDSMKVTILITNNTEGITCTMNDTLYWKETEVIPGSFIGNWEVLSSNGGVEKMITSAVNIKDAENIALFPCPAHNHFQIIKIPNIYTLTISDLNGQTIETINNIHAQIKVDISSYPSGMYLVQFWDENKRKIIVRKMIKI